MDRKLMHYYKRNLGDYAKKAGRLSMLQHGAYTLLIDACYDREQFPTRAEAIDWTWASSTAEIEAVDFVLSKFFTLEDDRYVQKRIKEEIAAYHETSETNKRIAAEREAKRKAALTDRARSVHEAPPNQEPITNNQEPYSVPKGTGRASPNGSRLPADWSMPDEWAEFCKTERPDLIPSEVACRFADYWHGVAGAKGRKADWLATWRNWVRAEKKTPVGASGGLETAYQRSMRERMQEAAPEFARKAPGKPAENVVEFFVVEAATKRLEIGNEPSSAVG
jgi:uncharacterized protein YdaU (DUF1376 family)